MQVTTDTQAREILERAFPTTTTPLLSSTLADLTKPQRKAFARIFRTVMVREARHHEFFLPWLRMPHVYAHNGAIDNAALAIQSACQNGTVRLDEELVEEVMTYVNKISKRILEHVDPTFDFVPSIQWLEKMDTVRRLVLAMGCTPVTNTRGRVHYSGFPGI